MNSFVIRNQWPRTRSLNSMLISLKALVVFKVNFLLQLILQLLQSGIHHAVLWKLSMKFWGRNLIVLSHKECKDKLPSQLTWLTPLFVSLRTTERLDLDHKDLYKAIRRPCYFTPTPEDIFPELSDVSCFSILDALSGYWNIKLKWGLLCISLNSPFGRYRFLHLPFGLISAPDMLQRMIDETFGDLPGVTVIADNFVYGCSDRDHDENLHAFLQCACDTSLHFYLDKFECARIPFTSHIIGDDGLQTDSHKFDSLLSMDLSTSLVTLQECLRIVQLAFTTAHLRSVTKKTSEFVWSTQHQ